MVRTERTAFQDVKHKNDMLRRERFFLPTKSILILVASQKNTFKPIFMQVNMRFIPGTSEAFLQIILCKAMSSQENWY